MTPEADCTDVEADARVRRWSQDARLDPVEVDCVTAIMLKILDGKCKMIEGEKVVMEALYDAVKHRAGNRLHIDVHQLIATARSARGADANETCADQVYESRVLAENAISRPVMKAFKARLRAEGVLEPKR